MLAVIRTGRDAYGMAIRRELEDVTGRDVAVGTVSRPSTASRPSGRRIETRHGRRRCAAAVTLTTAGARALAESRAMRDQLWRGVVLPASS